MIEQTEQAVTPETQNGTALLAQTVQTPWYHLDTDRQMLTFRADTPYPVWERATTRLLEVERTVQWAIGDALLFGEAAYGERYAQVIDPERYAPATLVRMARVARAIPAHRRRPNLDYTIHAEVSHLPEAEQERLLDYARAHDSSTQEVRVMARRAQRALALAAFEARPRPALGDGLPSVGVADARTLPLPSNTIDLTVTSPPYGVAISYGVGDIPAEDWTAFMHEWLLEAYRVVKPHGRLALNIPLDTARGGYRPTYAQSVLAALAAGWEYRSTVIWVDNQTTKGNRALGSVDSSASPYHVSQVEMIILLSKGDWGPSSANPDDITSEQWQEAGRGPWLFPGESHAWEGYPAAFPLTLPLRLIRYLSRRGDLILDPFVGSGTTLVAAHLAGRRGVGYDLDPAAVASSQRRLAALGSPEDRAPSGRSSGGPALEHGDADDAVDVDAQ